MRSNNSKLIFIILGGPGYGKTTLVNYLTKKRKIDLVFEDFAYKRDNKKFESKVLREVIKCRHSKKRIAVVCRRTREINHNWDFRTNHNVTWLLVSLQNFEIPDLVQLGLDSYNLKKFQSLWAESIQKKTKTRPYLSITIGKDGLIKNEISSFYKVNNKVAQTIKPAIPDRKP